MQVDRTRMYRVAAIAALLDVHAATVYRAVAAGELQALRIGTGKGAVRVTGEALGAYLTSLGISVEYVDAFGEVA